MKTCEPFIQLPSGEEWKTYYETVPTPISLQDIYTRIVNDVYKTIDAMQQDVELMAANELLFFGSDSERARSSDVLLVLLGV